MTPTLLGFCSRVRSCSLWVLQTPRPPGWCCGDVSAASDPRTPPTGRPPVSAALFRSTHSGTSRSTRAPSTRVTGCAGCAHVPGLRSPVLGRVDAASQTMRTVSRSRQMESSADDGVIGNFDWTGINWQIDLHVVDSATTERIRSLTTKEIPFSVAKATDTTIGWFSDP